MRLFPLSPSLPLHLPIFFSLPLHLSIMLYLSILPFYPFFHLYLCLILSLSVSLTHRENSLIVLLHAIVTKKGDARMTLMLFFFHVARSSSTS